MDTSFRWPATLDLVGLGVVFVLCILGLYRGLWWQVIRLLGVTLAVVLARWLGPSLTLWLQTTWPDLASRTAWGIAWGVPFVLALFSFALLGLLGQRVLEAMKLDLANRLAGGFAGAATGLFVHIALVVLVCHFAPEPFLGRYVAGSYSERLYAAFGLRWPVVMASSGAHEVEQVLERSPNHYHVQRGVVR
jgi:uncharacterized membrane protein required for colicin V production